jgi:hypothetical protein
VDRTSPEQSVSTAAIRELELFIMDILFLWEIAWKPAGSVTTVAVPNIIHPAS